MNLQLKSLTAGVAALLLMSGIFANQALAAATPRPAITSPSTKSCVVGTACSYTITATNSPTSYNATGLQSWQSRSADVIWGTPTTAGTFSVTVSATNTGGTGSLVVAFTVTLPPARVVVAPSGGNYTTISAAMAAMNPTATNPAVIEVLPGIYNEPSTVYLKSYVHLKGSGRDVTTVKTALGTGAHVIVASGLTNVAISGLTITGGQHAIYVEGTTGTIYENTLSNNSQYGIAVSNYNFPSFPAHSLSITNNKVTGNANIGIYADAAIVITNNTISATARDSLPALYLIRENSIVTGNVITENMGRGISVIIGANPVISGNLITNNKGVGVMYSNVDTGGKLTNNTITNNGTLNGEGDVIVDGTSSSVPPNISFNVFDVITGARGVGSYNVNSNGDPILVP